MTVNGYNNVLFFFHGGGGGGRGAVLLCVLFVFVLIRVASAPCKMVTNKYDAVMPRSLA